MPVWIEALPEPSRSSLTATRVSVVSRLISARRLFMQPLNQNLPANKTQNSQSAMDRASQSSSPPIRFRRDDRDNRGGRGAIAGGGWAGIAGAKIRDSSSDSARARGITARI